MYVDLPKCANQDCNNKVTLTKKGKPALCCSKKCTATVNSRNSRDKMMATSMERYGSKTYHSSEEFKILNQQRNIELYGVPHHMNRIEIKEKVKATVLEKYGVENISHLESNKLAKSEMMKDIRANTDFNSRVKATNVEKYGVDHFSKTTEWKEQFKEQSLLKYGVDNPSKSPIVIEKIRESQIAKYGKLFQQLNISQNTLDKLNSIEWLTENKNKNLVELAATLGDVTYHTVNYYYCKHGVELDPTRGTSMGEREIADYIRELNITNIVTKDRKVLNGKELDIYLPDYNLAIEYNGLFYHSEFGMGKDKHYHLNKTNLAETKGIKLFHVWSHEWENKKEIVKSRIASALGQTKKLHGRKCKVELITSNIANTFLEENHIQGKCQSSYNYGLYYNGELVSVMTFGKPRFNKDSEYELYRFCHKLNHTVVGGASKLLSAFIKDINPQSIISYADRRWSSSNNAVYGKLSFELKDIKQKPSFHYTYMHKTYENRMKYQKHKLKDILPVYNSSLSALQNMINNGYDILWDCGHDVWELKR